MDKKIFFPKIYPLSLDLSKTWFIKFKDSSGRTHKKYGIINHFPTVELRLQEAKRMIQKLQDQENELIKKKQGIIAYLEAAHEYHRPTLAKKSEQGYFSHIKKFATWYRLATKENKEVDPADYIRYLYECNYHNNYIRKAKAILSQYFNVMVGKKQYPVNPFDHIKVRKKKSRSLLPFHSSQIEAIKNLTTLQDPQLWDAILFQYYLFFRPAEIRQLRIGHIIFEEMMIEANSDITKDDDEVRKVIPLPMRPMMEKYRSYPRNYYIFSTGGQPGLTMLGSNNLTNRHRKILNQLDISNRYAFYSWVHTGIRESVMSGIPHKQLQLQKGHSDLEVFDEYLKSLKIADCVQLVQHFPAI